MEIETVSVDTLFIDDVLGLPAGLTWDNDGENAFVLAGQDACITISGQVTNAQVGSYPLIVKVSGAGTAQAFGSELVFNTNDLVTRQNVLDFDNYSIVVEEQQVAGCTDSESFNFNPNANTDDGSCIAVVNGCTNASACNYDSAANTNDGSCFACLSGCTDASATNFD